MRRGRRYIWQLWIGIVIGVVFVASVGGILMAAVAFGEWLAR